MTKRKERDLYLWTIVIILVADLVYSLYRVFRKENDGRNQMR